MVFSGILIQFYVYYLVLFVVGFFYIYIWSMVRSLFLVMGRIDYTGRWIYNKKINILYKLFMKTAIS